MSRGPAGAPGTEASPSGPAAQATGELQQAEARYRSAVAQSPGDAAAHFMLGNTLAAQGRRHEAIECYRAALRLRREFPEASANLGTALKEEGRLEEAIPCYEDAIRLRPELMEAHFNLGLVFQERGEFGQAMACYEAAVRLRPELPELQYSLGYLYANADRREEALVCFRNALTQDPEYAEARWGQALSQLLAVCGPGDDPTRGRAAFAAELDALERWFHGARIASGARAVGTVQPFRLAYQEEDNRDLMRRYGRLCTRLMSHWARQESIPPPVERRRGEPVRVAVVTRYFASHPVWNAIAKGWFEKLGRGRIVLDAYCLGPADNPEAEFAKAHASHFEQGANSLRQWVDAVRGRQPDVVIYPELGMDPMTLRLASLRLAKVQAVAWGHPETSGLPTIDYYLSAEDFEPSGAQAHYTERLVPLPHLGCYVEASNTAADEPDLQTWGLDASLPILLCPGTPFKYAPGHDAVLARIASRLRDCQLVFFTYRPQELSQRLRQRLEAAFRDAGLDPRAHLRFIPWLSPPAFHGLMRRADVYLDTIGFSGFNTAMQAVECGLPIVTREGRFMRGRFGSGILRRLGAPELVAASDEEYVALAAKLVLDRRFAADMRERIAARRATLFGDLAAVDALEGFIVRAAEGRAG